MNLFATSILVWALSAGYIPEQVQLLGPGTGIAVEDVFRQDIELGLETGPLYVWTSIETRETTETGLAYMPFSSTYRIGAEVRAKVGTASLLTLGAKHACIHPVVSSTGYQSPSSLLGSETEFFVRVSGRAGL